MSVKIMIRFLAAWKEEEKKKAKKAAKPNQNTHTHNSTKINLIQTIHPLR